MLTRDEVDDDGRGGESCVLRPGGETLPLIAYSQLRIAVCLRIAVIFTVIRYGSMNTA